MDRFDEQASTVLAMYFDNIDKPPTGLHDAIAAALRAAHCVPDGCVRLPDGRLARVSILGMEVLMNIASGCAWTANAEPFFPLNHDGAGALAAQAAANAKGEK